MIPGDIERKILILASCGFHGKTIARFVKKYEGRSYSVSTIYRVARRYGVQLRDYRDGRGSYALENLKKAYKGAKRSDFR